jgi:hypothetical protein
LTSFNPFRPRRLRIVEAGWEGYTGLVGPVEFVNAISVDPVSAREQAVIGGIIRIESIDEGEEGTQVGPSAELVRSRDIDADHERVAATEQGIPVGNHGEMRLAVERYTREELEDIADRRGINGLRDIADPIGAKGRSINEVINSILKAQASTEAPAPVSEPAPEKTEATDPVEP